MNVFGNTCPMCCGDLGKVAHPRGGVNVCRSCGCDAEAPAQLTAPLDLAPAGWVLPPLDIRGQTSALLAPSKIVNV
jgi:hypothetical protein